MQPLCKVIRTLLLSVLLPWSSTGQFHVIGPRAPIVALAGEEVVLSCHLDPAMDAQNMEVRWHRKYPSGLVHHYGASEVNMEQQMPEYRGRTEFLKENITKGQVALKIYPIHPSDDGEFSCFFENSIHYEEAHIELLVTGSGVAPRIHIALDNAKEVKLTCTSTGWYPEPEVQWRDLQGQHLVPDSETKTKDGNGLFSVETSITVDKSSKGIVSCFIINLVLGEEKEAHISVADNLFPRDNPWITVLTVLLSLLVVAIALGAVYAVRTKKAKGSLKRKHDELNEKYELLTKQKEEIEKEKENLKKEKEEIEEEKENLKKDKDKISKFLDSRTAENIENLDKARRFAEDIMLDKTTAHPNLRVSDDGKSVTSFSQRQKLPESPEQFDTLVAVLGQNSYFSGDHYWEVNIAAKTWVVGLCVESVNRKGQNISLNPENGFWTISPSYVYTLTSRLFSSGSEHLTVGIFLQYDKGLISFYNVLNLTVIHTFKSNFTQPLKPYFSLSIVNHDIITINKNQVKGPVINS